MVAGASGMEDLIMREFFNADAIVGSVTINDEKDRQETSVVVFNNEEYGQIRVVMRGEVPWFYASDVATALGYSRPADAVNAHCKKACKINQYCKSPNRPPITVNVIPESDVFRLVMRSCLPSAERFQDWVCEEVLPSIRKTGSYTIAGIPVPRFDSPADAARAWADQYEARLVAEKKAVYEAARADLAMATKAHIVAGRDSYLMQQRHEDLRTIRRKDERNGKLESRIVEQGIELGAERTRADKAENALGIGKTYRCVTNIPWFREVFDLKNCKANVVYQQAGRRLKRLSDEMGYGYQTVPGHRFDAKAYHIDVIAEFRARLEGDPDLMGGYRK